MTVSAHGRNGDMTFDGTFVTITRRGFLARSTIGKGEKRIPLTSIAAVQWKPADRIANGFLQITVPGGNEVRSRFGYQSRDAVRDENSVIFNRRQQAGFAEVRAVVERAIASRV